MEASKCSGRRRWTAQSGSNSLKLAGNMFAHSDFTSYSKQVSASSLNFHFRSYPALHIQNLSNRCRDMYGQSNSRIFKSTFWRGFAIWSNCVAARRWRRRRRVRGGVQSTTTINARGKSSGGEGAIVYVCFCILKYTAGLSNSIQ